MIPRSILLQQVSKSFRTQQAVQEVDLMLAPGDCAGLVGHNGTGKTTLNPSDVYRMLDLAGTPNARLCSGMAGLAGDVRFLPACLYSGQSCRSAARCCCFSGGQI